MVSGRLAFTVLLCGVSFWFLVETLRLAGPARLVPLSIVLPTCGLLLVQLAFELWPRPTARDRAIQRSRGNGASKSPRGRTSHDLQRQNLSAMAWLGAIVLSIAVLGVLPGIPAFMLAYALIQWRLSWWGALLVGAAAFALLYVFFSTGLVMDPGPAWLWQG